MAQVKLSKREEREHEHEGEPAESVTRPGAAPKVDVYESEAELLLVADLPGVRREDLRIEVEGEHLVIEGRCEQAEEGRARELAREFRPHDYRRRFTLPDDIDTEKITAQLASGILTMHLPKAAGRTPRRVEVKSIS